MTVFTLITFPMISNSLLAAGLLTFTISFDDVVLSSFLSGPGSNTLPIVLFGMARFGISPEINATATILVLAVSTLLITGSLYIRRREKRMAREIQEALRQGGKS